MHSSSLTVKGQVTIPADLREQLGLQPGDKVGFAKEGDHIILFRKENIIEAAFGIGHPKTTVSITDIDATIRKRGSNASS